MAYLNPIVSDCLNIYIKRNFSSMRDNIGVVNPQDDKVNFNKLVMLESNDPYVNFGTNEGDLLTSYNISSDELKQLYPNYTVNSGGWLNSAFWNTDEIYPSVVNYFSKYSMFENLDVTIDEGTNLCFYYDLSRMKGEFALPEIPAAKVNFTNGSVGPYQWWSAFTTTDYSEWTGEVYNKNNYIAVFGESLAPVLYYGEKGGIRAKYSRGMVCVKSETTYGRVGLVVDLNGSETYNNNNIIITPPTGSKGAIYYPIDKLLKPTNSGFFSLATNLMIYAGIYFKHPIFTNNYRLKDTFNTGIMYIHKEDYSNFYSYCVGIPVVYSEEEAISGTFTPPIIPDPNNPLDPGGTSTTGGGNGTFDDTSEPVDFAPLPSLTAINSGFVGLYAPTLSQLQGLSNYLWNESFNLDQLKKLFADPMDLLISLTIVPISPPITLQENIKVGFISTGLPMNKVEQQFITYDFGSLEIKPYFDSALDYSPFTKISIYLPYIGLRQLNVDEIMGETIHLQYNIDLFTGSCVAEIKVADSVLYTFNGNLASSIPLTAGNYSNFLSATMNVAANIGLAVATGGATGATSIASSAANLIASAKPNVEHTGSISSTTGYLSNKLPYLVYEIPRQSLPYKYQDYVGYPSNITSKLSDLSGYTEIESIHLENIPATMNELTEIESLLKQGVIL